MTKKARSYFKALLKSEQGEVLAEGNATVDVCEKTATFKSAFVPLYPIGTPMEIFRLNEDKEVHRFFGKVYLSAKTLMRIVSIDDELLPGSEEVYCTGMNLMATATSDFCAENNERNFFRRQRSKEEQEEKNFEIRITEMTKDYITFQLEDNPTRTDIDFLETKALDFWERSDPYAKVDVGIGHRFFISANSLLPLKETEVEVFSPYYFGVKPSFKCRFLWRSDEEKQALEAFLWQYNLGKNKLF